MSGPVLVIRTVSVEKMSPVLEACGAKWPGTPIWVVSNAARSGEMASDVRVSRVLLGGEGGFGCSLKVGTSVAAVVVPVANGHGSGYGNVYGAALAIDSESFWLCSRCRGLVELGRAGFRLRCWVEKGLASMSRGFASHWAERVLDD